jgi:hypothetical protein
MIMVSSSTESARFLSLSRKMKVAGGGCWLRSALQIISLSTCSKCAFNDSSAGCLISVIVVCEGCFHINLVAVEQFYLRYNSTT